MSDQGDTDYADQLASRIDVGDPEPKKEILRFLRVPYLLSERVLKLARDNQVFHVLGVVIARQALRFVLLLNAEVSRDGPNRAQLDERIKLQDQIFGLEAVLRECGTYSGGNQLEDSTSNGEQQHRLVMFDSNRGQDLSILSQEQVTLPSLDQLAYQQRVSRIKKQYDLFFPPSEAREENFNALLNYDENSISFGAWRQSRGLGQVGHATADSIGDRSTRHMDFNTIIPIVEPPTKASNANKSAKKSIFRFKRTSDVSSADPPEGKAPTDSTSTGNARGILNRKDGLHNFGVALELLKSIGEGSELLAPLKAVCGGLKVLVDTAEAIQQNKEDVRDLNIRLRDQLDVLQQQDEMLSNSDLKFVQKDVKIFVRSLTKYILDLNKVQKVLDNLKEKDTERAKKLLKRALMVHSAREDLNDCGRQLDESFHLFMNSVTRFIAHQAGLLRNDMAKMQMSADEKRANDPLAQLPCSDARGNQHDSCLEGTREDILTNITEWATSSADKPMFCLVDQAGTGKSTISTHMAQKWEKEGVLIGRFFFSLPNSITNASELPTTLARDMANSGPSLRSLILDAINDHPNIVGHSIGEKLEWFVFTPLKQWRDGMVKGLEEVREKMQKEAYSQGPANLHPEIVERMDIKGLEGYCQALEQVRKETGDGSYKDSLEQAYTAYTQALENAYVEALKRAPIVIIDALDECSIADRGILLKSMLSFLEEASLAHNHPLKIFLTCRPERDVLSHIQGPRSDSLVRQADFGMVLEENPSNHDDIRLYANKHLDQVLSAEEIHHFVLRANGLFIWASTARAFLADALDPSAHFEELLAPNTKSSSLDTLYDQVLRSAIDRVARDQVRLLKTVLQGICVAREPLSTRAMDELLGLSKGVAHRVVSMLGSVLSDGTGDKGVQALHPTFIEYLRAGSQPSDIFFSDGEAEILLAGGCLDVLSSPQLRFDICGVMGPDRFAPKNKDIEDLRQRLEENVSPGLQYATVHGLSHVALCLGDNAVLKRLQGFFMSNLLYWIELMSLIGRVYHLMQSIHHLKSQIEDGMRQSMDVLNAVDRDWCEEILKLVQPCQAAIEKSALQVYFSALPFAPSTSQISHFYDRSFVDRIPKVLHGAWRVQPQYTALSDHTGIVGCLSFSPDGQRLASGSTDHTVRLWDATTGAAIGDPLTGHTNDITCLSFSPDGQTLASGSGDSTVRLWNATTGAVIGDPLDGHANEVTCLSFSPDGQTLASGSGDGTVRLWNATTGAAIGDPLTGHTKWVICLSFSLDGRRLASGSWDRTVRLWDATNGASISKPAQCGSYVRSLSFHIRDETLYLAVNNEPAVWKVSEDGLVTLDSEQQLPELVVPHSKSCRFEDPWTYVQSSTGFRFSLPSSFQCREFASHGGILAYGGSDGSVIIIDCSHLV